MAYLPFPMEGHTARWNTWDLAHREDLTILWENEGWTISGVVERERVQYVLRANASFRVSQFLLFRDLEEPDLWLATDGSSRWGEMNGAHRPDLDGCYDIRLACTPFTHTVPIRRLPLQVGDTAEISVVRIDVDTLEAVPELVRYTRLDTHRWAFTADHEHTVEFDVDGCGLVVDQPGAFRRAP